MKPPIEGMTTNPFGEEFMAPAFLGCLVANSTIERFHEEFKRETGEDLLSVMRARGINKMVDEATGRDKATLIAWADWVTKHIWGEEDEKSILLG